MGIARACSIAVGVLAAVASSAALLRTARGSTIALLFWLGVLDYFLYGYAYFLFGAAFNPLFLVYVLMVALSSVAIAFALLNIDANAMMNGVAPRPTDRWIAGYMFFVAAGLTTVYAVQSIAFIVTG